MIKQIYQFISSETGQRSDPFEATWDDLYKVLQNQKSDEDPINENDFILLCMVVDGENSSIPKSPLITVKSFMEFKDTQNSLKDGTND